MSTKILALLALLSGTAQAAYFPTFSINNFSSLGIYNSSLPTLTNGSTSQLQVDVNGKLIVSDSSNSTNWTNLLSLTTSINNKTPALGQTTMSGSQPVVLASDQSAIPVTLSSAPLPPGASTAALQTTGNTSLSSIDGKTPALGQALAASSVPVVLTASQLSTLTPLTSVTVTQATGTNLHTVVDSGAVTVSQATGTNLHTVVDSSALPSGAAIAANQTNVQSAVGSSASTAVTIQGSVSGVAIPISGTVTTSGTSSVNVAQIGGSSVVQAASGVQRVGIVGSTGQSMDSTAGVSNSQAITIQGNGSGIAVPVSNTAFGKAPVNVTGSGSSAGATVSTVATLTAPANAVGFVLMNLDTSTANIRWAVGRTASTTLGQQLQPGRDSGFVPIGANISIIAESGTQNYDVQWISQ